MRLTISLAVVVLAVSMTSIAAAGECYPTPEGLVAWWSANANAEDLQGQNHGTLHGGAGFVEGLCREAFDFDGIDSYVQVPDAPDLNPSAAISVGAWIMPHAFSGCGNNSIVDKPYEAHVYPYYQYHLGITGVDYNEHRGVLGFDVAPGGHRVRVYFLPEAYVPEQWTLVVGTYDGTAARLYVDGELKASVAASGALPDYGQPLRIAAFGNLDDRAVFFTPAIVDEVFIFDRALSGDEIAALYAASSHCFCKDEDGDGFRPPEDCDEADPSVNPAAVEMPGNFVDENCDGNLGSCDPCSDWKNHGQYVRCVAREAADLVEKGRISEERGDDLVRDAARSDIGKRGYHAPECPPTDPS